MATKTKSQKSSSSCCTSSTPLATSRMKQSFYAVAVGHQRGIFSTWEQCSAQVTGFSGAVFKSFRNLSDARGFLAAHPDSPEPQRYAQRADVAPAPVARSQPQVGQRRQRPAWDEEEYVAASPSAPPPQRRKVEEEEVRPRVTAAPQRPAPSPQQVVYVDGACSHNGTPRARAGYGGFYGTTGDSRNFSLPVPLTEAQTNNRGEMRAVIHSIVQGFVDAGAPAAALATSHSVSPDWSRAELTRPLPRLVINTDSRYVIDGLTRYAGKWVENGFKLASKEPVLNQDLWKQMIRLRDAYNTRYAEQQQQQQQQQQQDRQRAAALPPKRFHVGNTRNDETEGLELRHVRGHSNDYGNEMADGLAVNGSRIHGSSKRTT